MRLPILIAFFSAFMAHATPVWDQSPPNSNSFNITDGRLADDFSLSQAITLSGINFWYQAQFQGDLSNATYAIYQDSGGSLGSLVATGIASPTTADQTDFFFASFAVPSVSLSAGSYWLELHAGSTLTDDNGGLTIWWAATDDNATHIARSSSSSVPNSPVNVSGFNQYAFQLTGSIDTTPPSVPEPSTGAFITVAVVALVARAKAARKE